MDRESCAARLVPGRLRRRLRRPSGLSRPVLWHAHGQHISFLTGLPAGPLPYGHAAIAAWRAFPSWGPRWGEIIVNPNAAPKTGSCCWILWSNKMDDMDDTKNVKTTPGAKGDHSWAIGQAVRIVKKIKEAMNP